MLNGYESYDKDLLKKTGNPGELDHYSQKFTKLMII